MITIRQSITINRPVEEVYRFMTEAGNIFKYSRNTVEIRQLTAESLKVGSKYEFISKFLGRYVRTVLEVVEVTENKSVTSRSIDGPFGLVGSTMFDSVDGNTVVTSENQIEAHGLWKILEPLLPGILRRQSMRDYARLRDVLESELHKVDSEMSVVGMTQPKVQLT